MNFGGGGMRRRFVHDMVMLFVAALLLRTLYMRWLGWRVGFDQFSDFHYLFELARSLAQGDGLTLDGVRIWNQSLGYPLFLAPFLWLFGMHIGVALAVNLLLGCVACGLVYLLARLLYADRRVALLAGLLCAIYPDLLLYAGLCASENLLLPLALGMACAAVYKWRRAWLGGLVCGLLAALAATTKAHVFFLVPVLPLYWMVTRRQWLTMSLCAAATGLLFLLPWTIHNYRLSGHFVPFAAVAGETFLDGNNPAARGVPSGITTLPEIEQTGLHPVEKDRLKMRRAVSFIRDNPAAYARLLGMKAVRMLLPARDFVFEAGGGSRFFGLAGSRYLPTLFNMLLYVGIGLALISPFWNAFCNSSASRFPLPAFQAHWVFALSVAGMMTLMQLIFFAYSRYRLPFLVLLLPAVADTFLRLMRHRKCVSGRDGFHVGCGG